MNRLDYESGETTPALSDIEKGRKKKRVTFSELPRYNTHKQKRKKKAKHIKREQGQVDCKSTFITGSYLICMILVIIICIIYIVKYYIDTLIERDHINNKVVIVSERWINYNIQEPYEQVHLKGRLIQTHAIVIGCDGKQVNCTNTNPCKEWLCSYISEHFHKTPDECEYKDYLVPVAILNIVFVVCCICNFIKN